MTLYNEYDEEYEEEELEQEKPLEPAPEPVLPEPPKEPTFRWIGDPRRPEAQEKDGVSDLFAGENDPDTDDVVNVDIDGDIIDADEDGTLGDMLDVTEDDVLGDEDTGQIPLDSGIRARKKREAQKRMKNRYPPTPDSGMRGVRI